MLRREIKKSWQVVLIAVFLLLFNPIKSNAQLVRGFGFKTGAVVADQSWDFSGQVSGFPDKDGDRWGFDAGGFVELFGTGPFSLVPEVHYIQKGMTYKIQETSYNFPSGTGQFLIFRPLIEYISVPVLVKVQPFSLPVAPYLLAGPRVDFLLSKNPEGLQFVYDKFKKSDFGATFGVGVEFLNVMTEFRYSHTFNDSFKGNFLGGPAQNQKQVI